MNLRLHPARLIVPLAALSLAISAEEVQVPGLDYYLPAQAKHDPAIPTPQQALGYQVGEWHLHHHELLSYCQQLATASDRVTLTEYARSHGRRPLLYLTITAPENHAQLDSLRKAHVQRALNPQPENADVQEAPLVIWMGYGVHGNEPSASNAAVLLAYHLAAARDPATVQLLQRCIILLEPCLNPDGFERFADWTNSHRGRFPSAHRADQEHQEGWPSGRSNYYWFDLNRDWLPAVHPESQGRLRLFHEWQPNIVTDYHEMGNVNRTYFFQPGIAKMVHPLTPTQNQTLTEKMAQAHAKALDAIGSLYYTGESYDDFYIGKGSTYPDVNGSVGVLFEQASSRGFHQDTEHGRLTFPFTIRNQLTTSLSTLQSASALRTEFLDYQQTFFRESLALAAKSTIKAHIVAAQGDPVRLADFLALLKQHHITAFHPAASIKANGKTFSSRESLVIPSEQRQHRLIQAMFETRTQFASNIFYDVSAWHLPSAYGLHHATLEALPAASPQEPPPPSGRLIGADPAYAYVFSWEPRHAPRALFALQAAKVRCWTAGRPFEVTVADKKVRYTHGSIVVPVGVQSELDPASLRRLMESIAKNNQLEVRALTTGYLGSVPDLGSPTFSPVTPTRVLLVVGPGITSTTAGDVWHQFDQVWQSPITQVQSSQLSPSLLRDFTTVILAGASVSSFSASARSAMEDWVSHGGNLIAIGSTVSSLATQDWCKIELIKATHPDHNTQPPSPYDQAAEVRTEKEVNGAIVRARFDPTHPLAYGFAKRGPDLHLMRDGTTYLKPAASSYLNPLIYTDEPLVSGFASPANQTAMRGSTPLQVKVVGSGRVIFFTDNPVFRGHWLGTEKLLANALFFGPLVSSSGGEEEEQNAATNSNAEAAH